jgi:hypothetical protein
MNELDKARESLRVAAALVDQHRFRRAWESIVAARDTLKDLAAEMYRDEKKRLDRERAAERPGL